MRRVTYVNGTIWTGLTIIPVVDSLTVDDGEIVAIGAPPTGEVVDLDGTFLMPAFADGHAHPILGGLEALGPPIRGARSVEEVVAAVAAYACGHPELKCIGGAGYWSILAPGGVFDAAWLDRAVPDRPVVLRSSDYHSVWCNTEALRRAGISVDSSDPPYGRIERDASGRPVGTLREPQACEPALRLVAPPGAMALRGAVRAAAAMFAAAGVTYVLDAWVDLDSGFIDAYLDVLSTAEPTLRVGIAMHVTPDGWRDQRPAFLAERRRVTAASDVVTLRTVKFFTDGVLMAGTAGVLEPYHDDPGSHGILMWDPRELADAVAAFDADGFDVHLHCIGDAATRAAVDAIEFALAQNPPRERRPTICHVQLAASEDLARMRSLDIVANFEPFWAQHDDFDRLLTVPRLGLRSVHQFPMREATDAGVRVAFGSDWPISSPRPLDGLHVAVNGRYLGMDDQTRRSRTERLTVAQVLHGYTTGVAHQVARTAGTLAPGSPADLAQLSRDPFCADEDHASIEVIGTWLGGHRTFDSAAPKKGP